jgi:predicted alpha/beta hydrolase family esterase
VKETIILMGCSTGCQDVLQYALTAHTSDPVEGVILQAPVSDREAFSLPELAELATRMREEGKADQLVPKELAKDLCGLEKLTAYRAWSLLGIG